MVYYIDGVDVSDYISNEFEFSEEKSLSGQDLIYVYDFDLLINSEEQTFNPDYTYGIWYGRSPRDSWIKITDDGITIYEGNVKDYNYNLSQKTMSLSVTSYLGTLLNQSVTYYENNLTPVEAFEDVLTINGLLNYISPENKYQSRILQDDNDVDCSYQFDIEANTNLLNLIQQLSWSGADIYTKENKIVYEQYNPNRPIEAGITILDEHLSSEVAIYSDSENRQNDFNIESTLFSYSGRDTTVGETSRSLYGSLPGLDINLSSTENINCEIGSALLWAGENLIYRNQDVKIYCEFQLEKDMLNYNMELNQIFQFSSSLNIAGTWEVIGFKKLKNIMTIKANKIGV